MNDDTVAIAGNAIHWARQHLGSSAYSTRCLAFVEDAIERGNGIEIFGGDDAAESARLYDAGRTSGEPGPGDLVFYESVGELFGSRRDWGHVGLGLGGGEVIHAWDEVRIDDYRSLGALAPAAGWEPLRLLGRVPLARVLEGSRVRAWSTDAVSEAVRQQADRFSGS
ncbi:NlpC/P60 family protein [Agromyces salentinus]|uniref:NlpC/P60 domain-containing protein n=1 Tax=Agromyces salentinus TaxID=269421 RepID=A0ABN2ME57_9MICO|nr:NlpC/P60 family protein [Agromyces salentinus]